MKRLALALILLVSMAELRSAHARPVGPLAVPRMGDPSLMCLNRAGDMNSLAVITAGVPWRGASEYTFMFWMCFRRAGESEFYSPVLSNFCSTDEALSYDESGVVRPCETNELIHAGWPEGLIQLSSSGTWSSNCLPANYEYPPGLADWQYGAYTVNIKTDTALTLTVAGDERQVAASNAVQKITFRGVSADRSITVAAASPSARVSIAAVETPLRQFFGDVMSDYYTGGESDFSNAVSNEWTLVVLRGRIVDGGAGVRFLQERWTFAGVSPVEVKDSTHSLWKPRADGAFDRMSRIAYNLCTPVDFYDGTTGRRSAVKVYGAKIYPRWLRDDELGVIHDRDAAEIRRRNLGPLGFPTPY